MLALLKSTWALLLGIVLLMAGNGLQSSLLGLRGSLEGFSSTVMGGLMSGYYIGFLLSSLLTPRGVRSVGHIRVFAALAALAAAAVILASLFVQPVAWLASRILTGFCYAGLYVVAESWINDRSGNETRGQLFSIYMLTQYAGLIAGQGMLNLAEPSGFQLFNLVALLISLAVIPILLTAKQAPAVAAPRHVGLRQLYGISPLGTIGTLGIGMAQSGFFSMGAVFGHRIGLSTEQVSLFLIAAVLGGATLQWPLGRLSDRFDRRRLLTMAAFAASALALAALLAARQSFPALIGAAFLFAGVSMPLYSLCVAHTNDSLRPDQMVAASGTLILLYGTGAIGGPFTDGALMGWFGPEAYWGYLGAGYLLLALFALYRMARRPARPRDKAGETAILETAAPGAAGLAPHPPAAPSRDA
ncbi:MAG TPA: MFS transporter [Dongiaceae bacterium]|nr:MFS transporter [Dongiaceae bacterium]